MKREPTQIVTDFPVSKLPTEDVCFEQKDTDKNNLDSIEEASYEPQVIFAFENYTNRAVSA